MRIELTENQLFEIVSRVITALQTNSKAINELTLVSVVSSDDYIELSEGKRMAVSTIVNKVQEFFGEDSITTSMLQNLCVTTVKVANAAITNAKLADGSVTLGKLAGEVTGTIMSGSTGFVTGDAVYQMFVDTALWERGTGNNSMKQKGGMNVVSGKFSIAEGDQQIVSGKYAHAEGYGNNVSKDYAHAEGYQTVVGGVASHAEGAGTTASGASSHAEGENTVASTTAHAEGYGTNASGKRSHTEGKDTYAGGNDSHAEGDSTKALGNQSHAEGHFTDAGELDVADNAHAEGYASGALGTGSHAEGGYGCGSTESKGDKRIAVLLSGSANAQQFTVDNFSNLDMIVSLLPGKKIVYGADEETDVNVRITAASIVGGVCTIYTNGRLSASALSSATFYLAGNTASGVNAHAEGNFNGALGVDSHAEGYMNVVSGRNSHVEGLSNIAQNDNEHVEGVFNKPRNGLVHSVGIGTDNEDRKNAEEIDGSGKKFLKGVGGYDGTNGGESGVSDVAKVINGNTALVGYAVCDTVASTATKSVTIDNFPSPSAFVGGGFKVKMTYANSAASDVKLLVNGTAAIGLKYNGEDVSATNTWKAGEVLSVYFDGEFYQATNAQGGGGSAEPSYVVPTWSGYVGASNATTISGLNLNNLTHYSNKSGSVSVQISSTSFLWFAVNREVRIESSGIEVPVEYMGAQNDLFYYKTCEEILPSTIGVELIATDASQGDDSGGGDTPTPTPTAQKPTIITPPQSATYTEGATPNALTVVASVSDGGTLSFQWYKDNRPFGSADSGTAVSNGVQSSITPTSVTATYYCVITNSKSGANSNTNQTTSVTITFSEGSDSEETDLTGFTEGKLDGNGNLVTDSNYVISPKYAVSDIANNQITIYDGFDNRSSGDPVLFLSIWAGTDESPEYKGKWSKNRNAANIKFTAVTGYNGAKGVFAKSEIDYCFLKIGNTYPFKGCKVENDFLSKILDFGVKYNAGVLESNNNYDASATRSNTFVVGPFNLEEGTYQIGSNISENMDSSIDRVTFFNNGDYVNRYFAKLSSFTYSNGKITRPGGTTAETIPSGSVFYILCAMSLMHECYLMRDGVYLWKGAKIV